MAQHHWPHAVSNVSCILCRNAREYFGGPFFDGEGWLLNSQRCSSFPLTCLGKFLHAALVPSRSLEGTIPSLEKEERESFLSFIRGMLTWLPEERKAARQLMGHPFLQLKSL